MNASPDIFGRLIMDHELHRDLLDALGETQGESEERRELFERLRRAIESHAAVEEQALYSTMMRTPATTARTRHSVAEHQEIENLLSALSATPMSSGAWLARFRDLRERYLRHIDEEDRKTFPEFAKHLTAEDEEHMQRVFEGIKEAAPGGAEVSAAPLEEAGA